MDIRAGDIVTWQFPASPYDATHFEHDITSPITLMFLAFPETGHVPDAGGTLMLLAVGLVTVVGCNRLSFEIERRPAKRKLLASGFRLPSAQRAPRVRPVLLRAPIDRRTPE